MAILNVTYCKDCIAYQKQSDGYNWCAYGSRVQMGDYGYCEKRKIQCTEARTYSWQFHQVHGE